MSLTYYIKKASKKKITDFFGTSHVSPPTIPKDIVLVNPYPESLYERRLWSVVGTFTDYMMRKMFRDRLVAESADIIQENYLVCEYAVTVSSKMAEAGKTNEVVDEIAKSGRKWIDTFQSKPFDSCIEETFMISQLDAVYRAGRFFPLHRLDQDEINGFKPFLNHILDWLKTEFSESSIVALNPTYGHPDICAADADMIIDDTLYEIKTTKYPEKSVSKDMNQLLGYVSLAYHHKNNPIQSSPPGFDIKNVGYLFPISVICLDTSISTFTDSHKESYLDRILELKQDEETVGPADEKNLSKSRNS
ncbi:MAG: hypothetical protein ACW98U_02200 [Candidatus Thorarchaeota archaeon]